MTTKSNTIVAFHVGRGGRFWNPGHKSFIGEHNIGYYTSDLFLYYENQSEIYNKIKGRPNLEEKFQECQDNDDFSWFIGKGFNFGEKIYFTETGCPVGLTLKEEESGIGEINTDGEYDTTSTCYLKDCSEAELKLILNSDEWNKINLIQEYFEDENIDWGKFNGDYDALIEAYFNGSFDVNDFLKEEENEDYWVTIVTI
jgi:hypothetical protein